MSTDAKTMDENLNSLMENGQSYSTVDNVDNDPDVRDMHRPGNGHDDGGWR